MHSKIYNVCSERHYEASKFEGLENPGISCHSFVWDDHNPPPLKLIAPMVDDMVSYLQEDDQNVVAVHCKAGKGRTGTIIACLLLKLQAGGISTPNEALRKFAVERTHNAKGVTIPSQMRYVHYYGKILSVSYLFLFLYYQLIQQYSHTHISPLFCRKKKKDRRSC